MTSVEFIKTKVKEITEAGLKSFPDDFLFPCSVKDTLLPGEILIIGNEFFGSFEVLTVKGDLFCYTDTLLNAKYLTYASVQKKQNISLPLNPEDTEQVVKSYEKYLDELLKSIGKDYNVSFPENKDINGIINEVFKRVNLKRL